MQFRPKWKQSLNLLSTTLSTWAKPWGKNQQSQRHQLKNDQKPLEQPKHIKNNKILTNYRGDKPSLHASKPPHSLSGFWFFWFFWVFPMVFDHFSGGLFRFFVFFGFSQCFLILYLEISEALQFVLSDFWVHLLSFWVRPSPYRGRGRQGEGRRGGFTKETEEPERVLS